MSHTWRTQPTRLPTASCQPNSGPRRCEFFQLCTWRHNAIFTGWWFQICFMFTPKFREDSHFDSYFSNELNPPTSFPTDLLIHDFCHCLLGGMDLWTNSIGFRPEPLFGGWVSHHFERPTSRVVETAWLDEWCWEFPKMFWSWLVGFFHWTQVHGFHHCKLEEWGEITALYGTSV